MYRFWKPEEISELKLLYSNTPNAELSARYNRTVRAIYATANNLGLRKSKEFIVNTAREISSRLKKRS